ncbi:MAG: 2,3-bisphosphoglycerate-independent phosphoglycerate mutase [Candidatus Magasanikbacteria bacterium]
MALSQRPVALIILDGFGIAPKSISNSISLAKTPFFDSLLAHYPSMLLNASGLSVGLPRGEVGNSEVGHTTIGSGILRYQSLPRIDRSIATGQFFKEKVLLEAFQNAKNNKKKIHFVGLIGNGGVHASQEHLEALLSFAKSMKIKKNVFIHAFLDGRDTARDVGKQFMEKLLIFCKKEKVGEVASVGGRFFAMDRNNNWDRIAKAYNAIVKGESEYRYRDPLDAISQFYNKEIYDEELPPFVLVDRKDRAIGNIEDGDMVVFFNFRADRARQLSEAFVSKDFKNFENLKYENLDFITFTEYKKDLPAKVIFSPEITANPIAKVISGFNLKQLHIAETEKYAHVTFFMNGMTEKAFVGEERILIPSPDVLSYDEKPEMSADLVTENIVKALKADKHDFYVINYANPDMVGHTGNLQACIKAVETVDISLQKIITEILKRGGTAFVMADHGNAEELVNPLTGEIDKEHNNYPVPFVIISNKFDGQANPDLKSMELPYLSPVGILADVAPTILTHMGLDVPAEMTGTNLF